MGTLGGWPGTPAGRVGAPVGKVGALGGRVCVLGGWLQKFTVQPIATRLPPLPVALPGLEEEDGRHPRQLGHD